MEAFQIFWGTSASTNISFVTLRFVNQIGRIQQHIPNFPFPACRSCQRMLHFAIRALRALKRSFRNKDLIVLSILLWYVHKLIRGHYPKGLFRTIAMQCAHFCLSGEQVIHLFIMFWGHSTNTIQPFIQVPRMILSPISFPIDEKYVGFASRVCLSVVDKILECQLLSHQDSLIALIK